MNRFKEIVLADFEFEVGHGEQPDDPEATSYGERPEPVCLVARELFSGRVHRVFQGEFGTAPPYPTGPDVLFVAYLASAELGCYRALGWAVPERIVDLYAEFRERTNGLPTVAGWGELGALAYFGLDHMDADAKNTIRRAIGNGTWRNKYTPKQILDYCEGDVDGIVRLLPVMWPKIDLPRALYRGRFMAAVAAMEWNGVPIDTDTLARLRAGWIGIQDQLITDIDSDYHVFEGRSFSVERFTNYLTRNDMSWPMEVDKRRSKRSPAAVYRLDLTDKTFREMAKSHPLISPLRELRSSLSSLRLNDLKVGRDGRNRTLLSPFRSRSGRSQPSNTQSIFGTSVWLRGLIKPPPGYGVVYIDWSQQEFGIAAYLSRDPKMIAAYEFGDCYMTFGKQAGMIPTDGNRRDYEYERELCKQCILGTQYGMGEILLAERLGVPVIVARNLLRLHRETYAVFWRWSDAALDIAMTTNSLHTAFGWHVHLGEDPNPLFLRNFIMQGNGAEMMRIAACIATERGVEVCLSVHDAFLICAPLDRLEEAITIMKQAMVEASRAVLGGFELRVDCPDEFDENGTPNEFPHVIRYPNRYMDKRGAKMWDTVLKHLDRLEATQGPVTIKATA